MEITVPDPDDVDELADLWVALADEQRALGSHLLAEPNRSTIRQAMARHLLVDGLRIAREDGDIVGFVMFAPETGTYDTDCDRGVVNNLYVRPERRDEGIGAKLLDAAEETFRTSGIETISLEALTANDAARRFYRRQGYTPHRVELEKELESDTHTKE